MDTLEKIFSSKSRAAFLRILYGIDSPELHLREIQRRAGLAIETIRKEAVNLKGLELILKRQDGNRTYFKANNQHPLFHEISQIVLKTSGLKEILQQSLDRENISFVFVFGSIAQGTANAESDIDLFIIGDVGLRQVTGYLKEPGKILGREINPHVMTSKELKKRSLAKDHFVSQVLNSKKLMIIGSEDELAGMVK